MPPHTDIADIFATLEDMTNDQLRSIIVQATWELYSRSKVSVSTT